MPLVSLDIAPFEDADAVRRLCNRATDLLFQWQGQGESANRPNNSGPEIDRWRSLVGARVGGGGSWCAVVQGAADITAAIELGMILPWQTSAGAKRYVRNVAAGGRWICRAGRWPRRRPIWHETSLKIPRGALVLWDRGQPERREERWKGHVERFVRFDGRMRMHTIGGNRNNRTDDGRRYAVVDEHIRTPAQWRHRLAGIVVPW